MGNSPYQILSQKKYGEFNSLGVFHTDLRNREPFLTSKLTSNVVVTLTGFFI
jgi:hypothetical protein